MPILQQKEKLLAQEFSSHIVEVRVNAEKAGFAVLSDVHEGLNNQKLFKQSVDFLLSLGQNVKVWLGGDATNTCTRNSKGDPLEEWATGDEQIYSLVNDIKPLVDSGQLIGISNGNHPHRVYNESFITLEAMIACLLGDRKLYKGDQGLIYFNVNKNLYVHYIMHKAMRKEFAYDYFNADVTWLEHYHKPSCKPKIIVEHNKYEKKPIVKECWEICNGSFQMYPNYSKQAGYRPSLPGFFITEMSGQKNNRGIIPFLDHQLYELVERGYKI